MPGLCRQSSLRFRPHDIHVYKPSLNIYTFGRRVTLHSHNRTVTNYSLLRRRWQAGSPKILSIYLLAGAGIFCSVLASRPLRLESLDTEFLGADSVSQKYVPPVQPCTIEQANEALRWEESSQTVGLGSGVLRFDAMRLPSNLPCEDEMIAASGHEDDEIRWLIWGVLDGHAYVSKKSMRNTSLQLQRMGNLYRFT